MTTKKEFIELFRKFGFNCFPIKTGKKIADSRYKASKTIPDQEIKEDENYGMIPTVAGKNCIIDFDNKEQYRRFCEAMITKGYMIIESPHGWHLPVTGISGTASKIELFDKNIQAKKIIEIQGTDHYCVGAGSMVNGEKDEVGKILEYKNVGSMKIWDAKGKYFEEIIDDICRQCKVESNKRPNSTIHNYRDRFKKGIPPRKGTSNDYFFQAALLSNTDGVSKDQAIANIQEVYNKWQDTPEFSDRPFSNIEAKINDVYENNLKITGGRPKASHEFDRTKTSATLLEEKDLYSIQSSGDLYENKDGFLEKINDTLKQEIIKIYPELEKADYDSIIFKLVANADGLPKTNKDLVVFKNGVFNKIEKTLLESDEIADMGFKDYDYLPPGEANNPHQFIKIMFDNVPEKEHPRVKAALRAILQNTLDPKISVTHGASGVGKSTGLTILVLVLKEYALTLELDQLLTDKFIKAKTQNKRLLVLQDMPKTYKDFSAIKALTGEQYRTERGFMQDAVSFENKLKIWGTANYLAKIPEDEKNAMYSRRLSLIHNERELPYDENPTLVKDIVDNEGEKIISWILNIDDADCKYEHPKTVKQEWENLASPEMEYLNTYYEIATDTDPQEVSIMRLVNDYKSRYQVEISIKDMAIALKELGYVLKFNVIKNIKDKKVIDNPGQKLL
jgi:ABC-type dipeptide/oligopeptide/nickel transport system ATPase subunit